MRLGLCVPWRAGDPHRERAWAYVYRHLSRIGCDMAVADTGHEPFNRAASRNEAAATLRSCNVLIFHDADMLADLDCYAQVAAQALEHGRMVVAFDKYRALNRVYTNLVLDAGANPFGLPGTQLRDFSLGGIVAMPRELFAEVGGYDERFVGWGGEDFALAHAATIAAGSVERASNLAVHLWHPHAAETQSPADDQTNAELLARWAEARTLAELREVAQ